MTTSILGPRPEYVVCIDDTDYPASLELHKIYRTLPDADASRSGDLRVIDESGEDYLFPATGFVAINPPERVRSSMQTPPQRRPSLESPQLLSERWKR